MKCDECYYLRGDEYSCWCACEYATEDEIEGKVDCEWFKVYWCKEKNPYDPPTKGYEE